MDRRTWLRSLGGAGIAATAGCLEGVIGSGDDGTVLDAPEQSRGDPIYPIHGEEFPSFSLPDPLTGETISSSDLVGERAFLLTYFFTSCPDGVCPALLLRLRRVQADSISSGYDDAVALLAMTFDPDRDTPETLETYADQQGVDLEAGNWHFLRPEDNEAARAEMEDTFQVPIERVDDEGGATDNSTAEHDNSTAEHDHGEYTFTHYGLITLVNDRGIVERAYPNATAQREEVEPESIVEDVRTVVGE